MLDEATSALDAESEKLVTNALEKFQKGRTCICIAHVMSTIEHASKICVLTKGKLAEEGSHEDLMRKRQIYYELKTKNMLNGAAI